jgi:Carbon storage regulator (could also regulate swarming and quorum sensing)
MLRLTVGAEDYLMIGEDIKIVFLGGSKNHLRIMIDAPKEMNVVRSRVIEKNVTDPEEKANLPHYYAVADLPEKYRKKKIVMNNAAKRTAKE